VESVRGKFSCEIGRRLRDFQKESGKCERKTELDKDTSRRNLAGVHKAISTTDKDISSFICFLRF
jgi:hypothetical protein